MSHEFIRWVFEHYPNGGSQLLVLLALADYADKTGYCFPSINAIAKKTRLSRSSAQRAVHSLIEAGFVKVVGNQYGGPPGATRHYQIMMTGSTHATGSVRATGSTDAQDGSHGCTETGSTHATQTIIEPSLTTNTHFEQFWNDYPKKKSKGDAEKAFRALKTNDELMAKILSVINAAKQSKDWQKEGGQYIPYPATWLRARGWEDESATSSTGSSGEEWEGAR